MDKNQTPEINPDENIVEEELETETEEPTAPSRRDKFVAALKFTAVIGGVTALAAAAAATAEVLTNRAVDALTSDEEDDCGCPTLELEVSPINDEIDAIMIKELETAISIDE